MDSLSFDSFENLIYAAEWRIGGNALWKSYVAQLPIRVFRSTRYKRSRFRAVQQKLSGSTITESKSRYRYDGLYKIVRVHPPDDSKGPLFFFLTRIDHGSGMSKNQIDTKVLMGHILQQQRNVQPPSKGGKLMDTLAGHQNCSTHVDTSKRFAVNDYTPNGHALFSPYQDHSVISRLSDCIKAVDELVACRAMMDIVHTD